VDEAVIQALLERLRAACMLATHLRVAQAEGVDEVEDEEVGAAEVASGNETTAKAMTTLVPERVHEYTV
jgi:hypothetical protein